MESNYLYSYSNWEYEYDTPEEAFEVLVDGFDALNKPLVRHDHGYRDRIDAIDTQRPLIAEILGSDNTAPQGLVLLERMLTETPSRFSESDVELLRYRGMQITAVNDERIMELAGSEDAEVSGRAMRLLYSHSEKLHRDTQRAFMVDNLMRLAWNAALNPDIELHNPKYATASLISCVRSKDESIASGAVNVVHEAMYTPETTGFGTEIYEGLIEYAFEDDRVFGARQETIDLYKTRPELLNYKLRLGDYLRRLGFHSAKTNDPIEVMFDVDAFYTQAKTDPAMMQAFQRSVGAYIALPQYAEKTPVLYERWMRATGHSYNTYIQGWNGGCGDKMRPQEYEDRNIEAMAAIELIEPGAVKVLTEEFGIRNFMRYPTRTLVNQYRNKDNKDLEYGVYIMPRTDHNSAFHPSNGHSNLIDAFERGLEQADAGMRIYEVSTNLEVLRTIHKAHYRYDKQLRFAVLNGHGTRNSLEIDASDILHGYVYRWHMNSLANQPAKRQGDKPVERLADAFADDASIIFDSCSTGKQDGLMDGLSDLLDLSSFAPVSPTKLASIGVESGDLPGSFELRPSYRDPGVMASQVRVRQRTKKNVVS
jgi:hypothetical protein